VTDEISHYPRRVVSLQPSVTAIIAEIGELEKLVACTKYCLDIYPQLKDSTRLIVADSWTVGSEEIMAASPDLVIASVPYQENAVVEILKAGVSFLGLAPHSLADIYRDIASIAGVLGAARRGDLVIENMQAGIREVREKVAGRRRPKVYCEEWGKPLIASQEWVAELVEAAGGEFVGTPGANTTAEDVQRADPEVIIASWCGAGDRVPLEKIVAKRSWENLRAVAKQNVFCIRDEYLNTPAPTLLHGLRALAGVIQPEVFAFAPGARRMSAIAK